MRTLRFVCLFALCCAGLMAQATSQIQGTVEDAQGASVAGAEVKAIQTDTGVVRTVTSGAGGEYVLSNLPVGPYRLEASKTGFSTFVQTGIVLQVATNPTVPIQLKVGAVSEQVQVEANAVQVETETTSVGAVIETQRILDLPLNGRQATDLIQLAGAAIPAGKNGTAGMAGGQYVSVAGGSLNGVAYALDGTQYNNPFDATNLPFPFPDALQEFKVETSTLTAQNGTHSAAAVQAVTRSGANAIHGDVFEFLRNGDLNARNFFALKRDTLKRNQWGGTLGGPIKKDKLFYFVGYQNTPTRSDPGSSITFVPTAQELTGDFSSWVNSCNKGKNLTGPFVDNRIPLSQVSPQALQIAKLLPAPNNPADPCGQVTYGAVIQTNEYQVLGRVDYQLSQKHSIFGRYMATTLYQPPAYGISKNILASTTGGLDDLANSATFGDTYLFSPNVVNQFRAAFNRVGVHRFNDDYFSGCDLGIAMTCYIPHQTVLAVTGGPGIGIGTAIQASFIPTILSANDSVSWVRGAHQFVFGFDMFHYVSSSNANVYSSGTFTFNGTATGSGLSDLVSGQLDSFLQGVPNTLFVHKWYFGVYGQDTWKVTRRFTLNAGLRWEPYLPQQVNNGAVYTFSMDRLLNGVTSKVFTGAPPGLYFPGDPGFAGKSGIRNRYDQFAPRIGLAFDPRGDGKTSLRASFGISYDFPNVQIFSTEATAPPFGDQITVNGPEPFATPFANQAGGNFFPVAFSATAPFTPTGTYVAVQPDMKATTVYSWNFSMEHELARNWLVSATYAGTETAHLWVSYQLNPALFLPGATSTATNQARRVITQLNPAIGKFYGPVDQFDGSGTANYNGLILSSKNRVGNLVNINFNYTWSHCIGDQTQAASVGGAQAGLLVPGNRRFDRGNCQTPTLNGPQGLDRRQIVNFTAVAQAPKFQNRVLGSVVSGWQLAGSWRASTGPYLTATTLDQQLSGTGGQRPNQIRANPLCADPKASCWINPAAFQLPALGTLGNLGRSSIPGPGFWEIDLALVRSFNVWEKRHFELRGEAFNLTNSFRALGTTTAQNSPQFGQILSAQDPRILQVAAKFVF